MLHFRLFFFVAVLTLPYITACSHPSKSEKPLVSKRSFSSSKNHIQKPLIVIDPGHGGFDLGAQTHDTEEKSIALSTAVILKKYLNDYGYPVMLTRTRDVFIPLKQRAHIANSSKSAIFISLHFNAAKNSGAQGIEIYYFDGGKNPRSSLSKKLAQNILSSLLYHTGASSRGIKPGNFVVIRETKMPAILIEGGFITHQTEGKKLTDKKYLEEIAKAITDGIEKYFKL